MSDRRLGFAEAYIVGAVEPEIARRRRQDDLLRWRTNFELHVRLQPPRLTWYRTLARVCPGLFCFTFPSRLPKGHVCVGEARYDVDLFDRAMALLPSPKPPRD